MELTEIAWAGGLFEGEGTVGNWANGPNGRMIVSRVVMTDRDVLERFVAAVSPVPIRLLGPHGPYGKSKKVQYQASTTNHEHTQALMAMLWPWLGSRRREQVRLALGGPNRPKVMTHCRNGHPYGRDSRGRKWCTICKSAYDKERHARTLRHG